MEKLIFVSHFCVTNWQTVLTGGIILTCAIIFLMGVLKKFLVGKIENKLLRKVALSFLSLIMVFPATALYFVSESVPFGYYWYACAGVAILTVLTYWLYENTGLRNLISLIGEVTIGKWVTVLVAAFTGRKSNEETKVELISVTEDLKATVREEVAKSIKASAATDNNLEDL